MSVTLGTADEARRFAAKHGLPGEVAYDPLPWGEAGSAPARFGFQTIPHTVLVDAEGRIAATFSEEEVMAETPVLEKIRELRRSDAKAPETPPPAPR